MSRASTRSGEAGVLDEDADGAPILPEHVAPARRTLRRHRIVTTTLLAVLLGGVASVVVERALASAAHDECVATADAEAARAVQALARGEAVAGAQAHRGRAGTVVVLNAAALDARPLLVVDGVLVAAGRVCAGE